MKLLILCVVLFAVSLALIVADVKTDKVLKTGFSCGLVTTVILISGVALFLMGVQALDTRIDIGSTTKELQQEYDSCRVLMEQGTYNESPFDIKMEFYDRVEDYNRRVTELQELPHSDWVGILYPDAYQDFETLPLPFGDEEIYNE